MKWFWTCFAIVVVISIGYHVTGNNESYFAPVADVYLPLNEHARDEHCFEGAMIVQCGRERSGYNVRGGTLRARVIAISDLGTVNGEHRASVMVQAMFDIVNSYHGWGWSQFDRPTIYGFIAPARAVGEGSSRSVENGDDVTVFSALPPPVAGVSRYAPVMHGSCSTDYRHDLCRFRGTVTISGDDQYIRIHLRERFR